MRIKAFKALRPVEDKITQVASLPYDVVSTEEAREFAKGNPLSMLNVVRAEINFPQGTSPYSDEVYAKAVENLQNLESEGHMTREESDSLYIYQQQWGEHIQRGIVALCLVEDYENNLIKKHEKTRQQKEDDRTRLTSDTASNTGPVFLTYKDETAVTAIVDETVKGAPIYDFTADDGIRHTAWKIEDNKTLQDAFGPVPCFYVADGHHRSASAARVGAERKAANPNHTGEELYNQFLCVIFPASELKILAYNRLVDDLNGLEAKELIEKISGIAKVTECSEDTPDIPGKSCMYLAGKWYLIEFNIPSESDPVDSLDVSQLQDKILNPFLNIDDPRTNDRIQFVGGIRGTKYLKDQVDAGKAAVAFSMHPTTIQQLMDIADADEIMPPKSTWFEPKLRSGIFVHTFEK